jgi:enoyl-CoA hydratase/carnithine racemase
MADLEVEQRDMITIFWLNRPERLNALSYEMRQGLFDGLQAYAEDDSKRCAIIGTRTPRAFCTGRDLVEQNRMNIEGTGRTQPIVGLHPVWDSLRKPIIAAIKGYALAGGLEMALRCDIRVAGENAKFGLPEVKRGIVAAGGGLAQLPRQVSLGDALYILLTGEHVDAATALRMGLVQRVVPDDQVDLEALQVAGAICEAGPLAVRVTKEVVYSTASMTVQEAQAVSTVYSREIQRSEDAKEGPRAFAEKRKPVWKGA